MKTYRKFASVLLALVMLFALAATASAAEVSVPEDAVLSGHTFAAYQIFDGDEANGVLSNITWGSGIDSVNFLAALKANYSDLFTDSCTTAADVAEVLGEHNTDSDLANAVAKLAYTHKTGNGTTLQSGTNTLADG